MTGETPVLLGVTRAGCHGAPEARQIGVGNMFKIAAARIFLVRRVIHHARLLGAINCAPTNNVPPQNLRAQELGIRCIFRLIRIDFSFIRPGFRPCYFQSLRKLIQHGSAT